MIKCDDIQQMLADYRTQNLNARQCGLIEEHLVHCKECAEELRFFDNVLRMVETNAPSFEPSVGLWNGVYNKITAQEPSSNGYVEMVRRWFAVPVRAAGVGIAVLALVAGVMLSGGSHNQTFQSNIVADSAFIQGHALYAGRAPLADQVSYLAVVAQSSQPKVSDLK